MKELKYLFFLGCVIPYRVPSYEVSARMVLDKLVVNLVEMPDFNCCGFPMAPVNYKLALTMAARDLCLAEQQKLNVLTLCNGCFGTLNEANRTLEEDKALREEINGYLKEVGIEFRGAIEVKHLVHVLAEDIGFEKIKEAIVKPLTNLRLAQHTGCHLLRPAKHVGHGDDPENPKMLKELISLTGAECLDYMDETECCGGPIIGVNDKIPLQLVRNKLTHVKAVGAQALITVCPFCHMMYDLNQPRVERLFNEDFGIPVLHYPQLLGLAMGMDPDELALKDLRVDASKIVREL